MKLSTLLKDLSFSGKYTDTSVCDITDKSSEIAPGCVFVCIKGNHFDGHSKAKEAMASGAAAVVCEYDLGLKNQIVVDDSRKAYSKLCAAFYDNPAEKLILIGITGTNGKTTTSFLIKNILDNCNIKAGLIGTVKNIAGDVEYPSSLTTPDSKELQFLFSEMVKSHCKYCIMEVSSQALAQGRVDGCRFAVSLFTNLTQDHLDYHKTFENYAAAKRKLFEISDTAIVNADDDYAHVMVDGLPCKVRTFGINDPLCDYRADEIEYHSDSVKYRLSEPNGKYGNVVIGIPGHFTVYNSMGAAACANELSIPFETVIKSLSDSLGVPGRVEVVNTNTDYTVLIDYAHSPDGLQKVISSVRETAKARVITVFGCGGDRDKTKRPIMGKIAGDLSDVAVVTSDNPRSEDPGLIIKDILSGMKDCRAEIVTIEDRIKAIEFALSIAEKNDVVLLAGKGHENYQILSTGKIHLDEREVIKNYLNN